MADGPVPPLTGKKKKGKKGGGSEEAAGSSSSHNGNVVLGDSVDVVDRQLKHGGNEEEEMVSDFKGLH